MNLDTVKAKQTLLEHFVIKGVNTPYWFDNMVKDSGLNNHVVNALCKEMSDEGYVNKTGQEASLTDKGYVFFHSGGYFPITQEQIKTENKIPSKKQVTPNANWLLRFIQNPVVKIVAYFIGALLIAYSIYYLRLNGDRPQQSSFSVCKNLAFFPTVLGRLTALHTATLYFSFSFPGYC